MDAEHVQKTTLINITQKLKKLPMTSVLKQLIITVRLSMTPTMFASNVKKDLLLMLITFVKH